MAAHALQVVLVDDYEPWRSFARSALEQHCASWCICEVSDGVAAVQKAHALQPDLILLDIGLSGLNGIEAAKLIRLECPHAKILFVSQEKSTDIVQAALDAGGNGYVAKLDGASELVRGVEAVLRGEAFVSTTVAKGGLLASSITDPRRF